MNKRVLVTGGAGYIGSVTVRLLLQAGYFVRVLDNLSFGGESLLELLNHNHFEFVKGDISKEEDLVKSLEDMDFVVHLAAIVGDPACAKMPELTHKINLEASKKLYELAQNNNIQKFIFASTCSNYGKMADTNSFVNEDSELKPVSLYAETKVGFEKYLLDQKSSSATLATILRFSTVYGLSPRMRFDLTVNEFTKDLTLGKELLVFGEQFYRPYCHVLDLARSVVVALEAENSLTAFEIFNVGDTKEKLSKASYCEAYPRTNP